MAAADGRLVRTGCRVAGSRGEAALISRSQSRLTASSFNSAPTVKPKAKMPRKPVQTSTVLRRSSRTKQTVQPTAPTKKAPAKKAKKPKVKVTKGKASDSSQEPNAAPAQNGENKEA